MIPTPEEAAEAIINILDAIWVEHASPGEWEQRLADYIRERDRAILDEAERDCWNLAALRSNVLGE